MVVLTEQIEIPASYEKIEAWTANFEEEFVKWSPYHIECKKHLPMPVFGIGRCFLCILPVNLFEFLMYSTSASSRDSTSATGCAQISPVSWKIAPRMNIDGM